MTRRKSFPLSFSHLILQRDSQRENLMSQYWNDVRHYVQQIALVNDQAALDRLQRFAPNTYQFHPLSPKGLYRKMQLQHWRCIYCEKPIEFSPSKWHMDHIYPISQKGVHRLGNIAISCPFCNRSKGKKPLAKWLGWREYLKIMRKVDDINVQLEREGYDPWNYKDVSNEPIVDDNPFSEYLEPNQSISKSPKTHPPEDAKPTEVETLAWLQNTLENARSPLKRLDFVDATGLSKTLVKTIIEQMVSTGVVRRTEQIERGVKVYRYALVENPWRPRRGRFTSVQCVCGRRVILARVRRQGFEGWWSMVCQGCKTMRYLHERDLS